MTDLAVRHGRPGSSRGNSSWLLDGVGCSYRQLQYWVSKRLLPDQVAGLGPGIYRHYTVADAEAAYAWLGLTRLGATMPTLRAAFDTVTSTPVAPGGEVLAVTVDGFVHRSPRVTRLAESAAAWVVPLRSFSRSGGFAASSAVDGGTPPADGNGRHRSAAVTPNL